MKSVVPSKPRLSFVDFLQAKEDEANRADPSRPARLAEARRQMEFDRKSLRRVIVCTAILGPPIRDANLAERLGTDWVNDSDRDEHSNWGWPLTDIEPVPNVPARGKQGWWTWTF